jgi:hypothetical protein
MMNQYNNIIAYFLFVGIYPLKLKEDIWEKDEIDIDRIYSNIVIYKYTEKDI